MSTVNPIISRREQKYIQLGKVCLSVVRCSLSLLVARQVSLSHHPSRFPFLAYLSFCLSLSCQDCTTTLAHNRAMRNVYERSMGDHGGGECNDDTSLEDNATLMTTAKSAVASRSGGTASTVGSGSFLSGAEDGFFDTLGADIRFLAQSLRNTVGGVATFMHQSALNVAAEIARLEEEDGELNYAHYLRQETLRQRSGEAEEGSETLPLPWEILIDGQTTEDAALKEQILSISADEQSLLTRVQPSDQSLQETFVLDGPRVHLIHRILRLDEDLARTHARLCGRSSVHEIVFWRNYFDKCEEHRRQFLQRFGQGQGTHPDLERSLDSLIPADTDPELLPVSDTASYVVPSPPVSCNSAECRSVNSVVFVDTVRR